MLEYGTEIAIIGMIGRFPGANSIEEFWNNLCAGVESISFFTEKELEAEGVDPAVWQQPYYVKAKAVIDNTELFDAEFFGFNPREAEITDPQQRIFLECAWEALENAGYDPTKFSGRIGVYAGAGPNMYLLNNLLSNPNLLQSLNGLDAVIGNNSDHLSTRVAYKLGLRGPALTVQTACSTSLVTVHLACQSLLYGECDMALAGGVSIAFPQKSGYIYQEGMIYSPDGHCRAFDEKAKGTVGGNGVGVVVLKRLQDAVVDGDYIYAVIRGSAINNDGSVKVGYTAPGLDGQSEVIAEAQAMAQVEPDTVTYVETHGTGTSLGDPIEVEALTQAFQQRTDKKNYCALGSVKTNIGHLNTAAGVAGLIKTVLALQHKKIPPSLHFEQPNSKIDFVRSPFYVNSQLSYWEVKDIPRRAGVSSFGIGGTNVHIVLEEALANESQESIRPWQLIILSAKTPGALLQIARNIVEHLESNPEINLADVAYTLQIGRKIFNYRQALVCRDIVDTKNQLNELTTIGLSGQVLNTAKPTVIFMFSAETSLDGLGMIGELYQSEQVFRDEMDHCLNLCQQHLEISMTPLLSLRDVMSDSVVLELKELDLTEIVIFIIQYSLAKLWMSWGINPYAMFGGGVGEYTSGCLSGVISLKDALILIQIRRKLRDSESVFSDAAEKSVVRYIKEIELHTPTIPYISSMTGSWITNAQAIDPEYWGGQLTETGDMQKGVEILLQGNGKIMLEVGLGTEWTVQVQEKVKNPGQQLVLSSLPGRGNSQNPGVFLLKTLSQLWMDGVLVDWFGFHNYEKRQRVPLPTYPFERRCYWIKPLTSSRPQLSEVTSTAGLNLSLHQRPNLSQEYIEPGDKTERTIVDIWQDLLGIEKVGIYDDFFELGGDSLLTPKLLTRLRDYFQVDIPLNNLFDSPTVAGIAQIIKQLEHPTAYNHTLDLKAEAVLALDIAANQEYVQVTNPTKIFLTGATGFLGAHLLATLLQQTQGIIYCLVRGDDVVEGMERLKNNMISQLVWNEATVSRIVPVLGDLSKPGLGLSQEVFEELSQQVDIIYHSGAWVNFTYPYHALKDANVLGTQEVLRLASRGKLKAVNYVSTIAIFDSPEYVNVNVVYEDDTLENIENLPIGYAQTKLVAERLLMDARSRGIPVCIYRFGIIGGHSQTGASNLKDLVWRMVKGCIQIGKYPEMHSLRLDIVPVDYVSQAIVHLSRELSSLGKVFHFSNPHHFSWNDLFNWVNSYGYPLDCVSQEEWTSELLKVFGQSDNALGPFISILTTPLPDEIEEAQAEGVNERRYDCKNTLEGLIGTSIDCPPIDNRLLSTYFTYFSSSDFLASPE